MLGIRPEQDQFYLKANIKRSSNLTNRLTGRFFVSGISGSFQKYKKQLLEEQGVYERPPKPPKYTYQPVLERYQREELRKDAEKLLELEEKLQEIQRLKEMKRHRDRQRRRKKLEYLSAKKIQVAFRSFYEKKYVGAVNVIKNFLQAVKAQQALYTANWAVGVIKRFAQYVSRRWWERRVLRKHAQIVALENWQLVTEVACIWTAARRTVTDAFVHHVINVGRNKALLTCTQQRRSNKKKKLVKKEKPAPANNSAYLQFFLTEFDNPAEEQDAASVYEYVDVSDDDEEEGDKSAKRRNNPNIKQASRYTKSASAAASGSSKKKQYDPNDHKVKQLIKKHAVVMKNMQEEESKRAALVEQMKQKAMEKAALQRQHEQQIKQQKENQKMEFLKKLEDDKLQRLTLLTKLRNLKDKKLKQIEEEKNREKEELRNMYKEDLLLRVYKYNNNARPKTASKAKKHGFANVVESVMKKDASTTATKDKEDNNAAEDAAAAALRKQKFQEALKERIKQKKAQDLALQKQKEEEEKKKKEKRAAFLDAYSEQLQKKKQELLAKKKKERQARRAEKRKQRLLLKQSLQEEGKDDTEEEEEEDDSEGEGERNEGEGEKEPISYSAEYEEHGERIEDFQFEEFLEKSISVYDKQDAGDDVEIDQRTNPLMLFPGEEAREDLASLPPVNVVPDLIPPNPNPANKPTAVPKKKTAVEKIPKALRNTPYFTSYLRQVEAGTTLTNKTIPTSTPTTAPNNENVANKGNPPKPFFIDTAVNPSSNAPKKTMPSAKSQTGSKEAFSQFNPHAYDSVEAVEELMELVLRAKHKLLQPVHKSAIMQSKIIEGNNENHDSADEPLATGVNTASSKAVGGLEVDIPPPLPTSNNNANPTAANSVIPSLPSVQYMLSNTSLLGKAPPSLPSLPTSVNEICQRHNINLAKDLGISSNPTGVYGSVKRTTNPTSLLKKGLSAPTLPQAIPTNPSNPSNKKAPATSVSKAKKVVPVLSMPQPSNPKPSIPIPASKKPSSSKKKTTPVASTEQETEDNMKVSLSMSNLSARSKNLRYQENAPSTNNNADAFAATGDEEERPASAESRPGTGGSSAMSSARSEHSSRVRDRLNQYQDYEAKLQEDYLLLKQQFAQKLQQQIQQNGSAPAITKGNVIDDPMRKSLTEHFVASSAANVSNNTNSNRAPFVPPAPTKISTKDLLMEWAMEDALEEAGIQPGQVPDGEGEDEEGEEEEEYEEDDGENTNPVEAQDNLLPPALYQKANVVPTSIKDMNVRGMPIREVEHDEEEEDEEEGEGEYDEEEDDEDEDYYNDHRQAMRQQTQYWNQLMTNSAHQQDADDSCLQLLHSLSSKMKTT